MSFCLLGIIWREITPLPHREGQGGGSLGCQAVEHLFDGVALDGLAGEELQPLAGAEQRVELRGRIADAVETADDGADARADDNIWVHTSLFHYLQHADMGSTLGTAATQHKSQTFRLALV